MKDFLQIFFTIIIVMDPFGMIPLYISTAGHLDIKTQKQVITRALIIAGVVLLIFLLLGKFLLDFFGIMPGAFYIAGGILFFIMALEMIYSKPSVRKSPDEIESESSGINSIALFPLAIPIIAGPGMITVIMMFLSDTSRSWLNSVLLVLPAILIGLALDFILLRFSVLILKVLRTTGIFVLGKIMGLILAGFAVQFIYNGLTALKIIAPGDNAAPCNRRRN
jgi:multiple antibiotic resistance protein